MLFDVQIHQCDARSCFGAFGQHKELGEGADAIELYVVAVGTTSAQLSFPKASAGVTISLKFGASSFVVM